MSIAMSLVGVDGIVLVTDGRLTEYLNNQPIHHDDHITKLWALTDYIGIISVGNILGYDVKIINTFQEKLGRKNIKSPKDVAEKFVEILRADFSSADILGKLPLPGLQNYQMEMILAGYSMTKNIEGETPKVYRIHLTPQQMFFSSRVEERPFYITGMPTIGRYWINKIYSCLLKMNIESLKRFGVMVVSESATSIDSVGGDIKMAVIKKGEKLQMVSADEIKEIEQHMSRVVDKERLIRLLEGLDN